MKRIQKGQFGYIGYRKKVSWLYTVICFGVSLGIFAAGMIITGDRKNIFTIIAVLGCLPAAKAMVNAIMFTRAAGCTAASSDTIEASMTDTGLTGLYDLYMTSYQTNFPVSHLVINGNSITGLIEDPGCNMAEAEKHISEHLKVDGFKDITVKLHNDTQVYVQRIAKLATLTDEHASRIPAMAETLKSISL
ncbi:MAG: hypothetical protein IJ058_01320 [Lachnospiraceae bacterium]|nr:hypothetical protein [Lachnospiraceae bacterium]